MIDYTDQTHHNITHDNTNEHDSALQNGVDLCENEGEWSRET